MKKGKEIKCCAHTKTDSMSTAVPAHLGRPTALSWLFLPSFVSTYCFFFFFFRSDTHRWATGAIRNPMPRYGWSTPWRDPKLIGRPTYFTIAWRNGRAVSDEPCPAAFTLDPPRDHPSVYTKTCPDPPAVRLIPSSSIIRIPSSP